MAEIRVFTGAGFLCRAICPELAGTTVSLKDITAARNARRRSLARGLRERASVVDRLLGAHQEQPRGPAQASHHPLRRERGVVGDGAPPPAWLTPPAAAGISRGTPGRVAACGLVVVTVSLGAVMVQIFRIRAAEVSSPGGPVRPSHGWRLPPRGEKRGDR